MTPMPIVHRNAPPWKGLRTAAIGTGAFEDAAEGAAFLRATCEALREEGFQAVLGPMDGSTWGKYRLPIWSDGSPAFAMEPVSGPHDLAAFEAAGFSIAETHVSATATPGSRGYGTAVNDIDVSCWAGLDGEALLAEAHALVMAGFRSTPLFTPLPLQAFVAAYAPLLSRADPRLILRARDSQGGAVGLTLAFPDPFRAGAVVLKTYVALVAGVGRMMADRVHELASDLGYREVIHALMREGIASAAQSRKFGGVVFRRYALMGRLL
ncbi:MAG: hypothetical protein P4L98_10875 [Ancalomicrobiaceae bacterium]|nr:hypothetical protein [Ancalomicrobiaceae bacterium]